MTAEDIPTLKAAIEAARKAHDPDELALRLRLARHPEQDVTTRVQEMVTAAACADRLGEPVQARSLAESALELATLHNLKGPRAAALYDLGVQLRWAGELARSESLLREAVEIASELPNKREHARCRSGLASTLYRLGKVDEAYDESLIATRIYRDIGVLSGVTLSLHLQAQIRGSQGLLDEARALLEEVVELDAISGDFLGQARSLGNLAVLLSQMQLPDEAIARLEHAKRLFEKVHSTGDVLRAGRNIASVHADQGKFELALQSLNAMEEEARRIGNTAEHSQTLVSQADVLQQLGRNDEAAEKLVLAKASAGDGWMLDHARLAAAIRARIALSKGDVAAAVALATESETHARTAGKQLLIAGSLQLKAEAMRMAGDLTGAREATLESIEILDAANAGRTDQYLICVTLAAQLEHERGNDEEAGFLAREGNSLRELLKIDDTTPSPKLRRVVEILNELTRHSG
ncbi:MAG: tetratricopeptide repeat protein [Planctomycetes bacterium]|nr:tetratricopeptide repeat protein [Planctomycetota bacterium]